MSEPDTYGLTPAQFNQINADCLEHAAATFSKFPLAQFTGAEVAQMLKDVAQLNPTKGSSK